MSGCNFCTPTKTCYWCAKKGKPKKPLKRTPLKKSTEPIKKVADKRAKELRQYSKEVAPWKVANDKCKARLAGCTGKTEHCHHMWGKENGLLLIKKHWLPVCPPCHDKINVMPIEEAIEKGLSERRNVSIEKRNN